MFCALLGPSDHVTVADQELLVRRLHRLGVKAVQLAAAEMPPAGTRLAVVNTKTRVDAALLDRFAELELLVTSTSGHDHVDLAAAAARGVRVARCPLARRDAVVDCSLALGLALLRRLPPLHREAAAGRWRRAEVKELPIPLLKGLPVGVVGFGVIGRAAAARWAALGADVHVADPAFPDLPPVAELLARSLLVTLHCSLTQTSRRLIRASTLKAMPPGALLVNTARGECVDLAALLADRRLGGFGLDVFTPEPPPQLERLGARDNVLLSPHSAGYHARLGAALADEISATVEDWLAAAPLPHELRAGETAT